MQLNKENHPQRYQIRRYETGAITVNEDCYRHSLVICADKLIAPWRPESLENIRPTDWEAILEWQPEILLLGTGTRFIMAKDSLLACLINAQIGVECMDTAAACRQFIALSADDRKVAAALLIK